MAPKHFLSAAAIVLNERNEILLIKGPKRGWEMPGGVVEEGESLKNAAIRETKEESGIDIEVTKFCGVFQNVSQSICNTLFLGRPIGGGINNDPGVFRSRIFSNRSSIRDGDFSKFQAENRVLFK